jgi:hypothetical protein
MIKKFIIPLAATFLVAATASAQTMILSETWSDGSRTNNDLPTSTAWYTSLASTTLTATAADGGSMTQSLANSAQVIGYLTYPSGKVPLEIGEIIELNFQFSLQNIVGDGNFIRFGLFDSSARIAVDNNGGGGFAGTSGFMANLTGQNQGASVDMRRRSDGRSNGSLILSTTDYFQSNVTDTLSEALVSDVIYTGSMVVTRSGTAENIVSASLTGPNGIIFSLAPYTETSAAVVSTGFDLVAFGISDGGRDSFTLHSLDVQVGPEPSTAALLVIGFMAIGAGCKRRIRR